MKIGGIAGNELQGDSRVGGFEGQNGSSALTRVGLTRTRLTGLSQTGGALCTGAAAAKRSLAPENHSG